uniref:C2H2-type domain-containing protein n=1 Tax=Anopheles christyi TaxID=43041 RepID=A0A182K7F8_9DIPT
MQTCVSCNVKNNGMIAIYQHPNGLDEMFHSITDIRVQSEDHLCVPCYDDLKVAHRFKQRCIQNIALRLTTQANKTTPPPVSAEQSVNSSTDVSTTYSESVSELTQIQNEIENSLNNEEKANSTVVEPEVTESSQRPKLEISLHNEPIQQDDVEISEELVDPEQDEEDQPLAHLSGEMKENSRNYDASKVETYINAIKEPVDDQTKTSATEEKDQSLPRLPKVHSLMCEYCFKEFELLDDKIEHTAMHQSETKPFKCVHDGCGSAFKDRVGLRAHVRIHATVKRYGCRYCLMRFHTLGNRNAHERTHNGEKPFICPKCGKGFAEGGNLKNHIRFHNGERPYPCSLCGKSYRTHYSRSVHMRSHTNERPYVCDECGKGFYSSGKLTIHRRTHTGERPYQCTSCSARFADTCGLKRHTVKRH